MAAGGPSTSKQADMLDDSLESMLEDFAMELENDEKTETAQKERRRETEMLQMSASQTEPKIDDLKNCIFKEKFYRVYRTMSENQAKHFVFHEIRDVHLQKAKGNVRLVGVYTYEPDESRHYLSNYNALGVDIENPSKVVLDMCYVEKFPVVNSCVEILGAVKQGKRSIFVVVYFFHELEENLVEEYLQLLRKQAQLFPSLSENC